MGMHEPGWRERNEERAMEEWDAEVARLVAELHGCADSVAAAAKQRNALYLVAALQDADEISNQLFRLRHGPENPDA